MEQDRPDPEALLNALKKEELKQNKGKLKIFLGMSAGVGKTYAMLEGAQKARKEGIDVVVGTVNTHGRQETANLLEDLKVIPEKWIHYKDTVFEEMDLDEILKVKPQLVIIDELAHANVPGSRHPKRWQDVMEILDAGIDVYTTLNVQHIESQKDVIEHITGIQIRETVPDIILESAAHIELVDITPTELLKRLKEGKVYLGPQSEIAARNFFQEDRLMALREIALRLTAEKVDHDLHGMMSSMDKPRGWKPRERLLVAVSSSPHSQHLIRTTRRLAFTLDAPWIALNVNNGQILNDEDNAMLAKNLSLARELGAEVLTTSDPDIVQAIHRIAKQRGITQIIIGRQFRKGIGRFFGSSLLEQLGAVASNTDILVVRQSRLGSLYKKKSKKFQSSELWSNYVIAFCFVLFISMINSFLNPIVGYTIIGYIYLFCILISSFFFKRGPIYFTAFLSALLWAYFFAPPEGVLIEKPEDITLTLFFFLIASVTSIFAQEIKEKEQMMQKREESTQAIYEIVREIAGAPSSSHIFKAVKERLGSILDGQCEIIVKKIDDGLIFESDVIHDEKERAVANWVFLNGKEAGWSTTTLSSVKALYIPLKGISEVVGVLTYQPNQNKHLTNEEINSVYTVAQQLANYLERTFSEERARKTEYLNQVEKIYQTILKLISHEFHPPLTMIQESLSHLKKVPLLQEKQEYIAEIKKIESLSGNLIRIVENISAMAKLSSGVVPLHKEPQNIKEIIINSCETLKSSLKFHQLNIIIPDDLPHIPCDYPLIELLLRNLIINAIDYTPPNTTIEVEAAVSENHFILSVSDQGKGIPEEMMDQVFEKFYRVPGTGGKGVGLGLAISKTIAKIHHGELKAQNREGGGAKFSLIIPLKRPKQKPSQ